MRWIRLKYEKLSDFYFTCGRFGLVLKSYGEGVKMATWDNFEWRYGLLMKVAPVRMGGYEFRKAKGRKEKDEVSSKQENRSEERGGDNTKTYKVGGSIREDGR
ncbi:hypothetical protein CRYUN_Cryun38cG0024100 [Craigia yunnanensis]